MFGEKDMNCDGISILLSECGVGDSFFFSPFKIVSRVKGKRWGVCLCARAYTHERYVLASKCTLLSDK